MYDRYSEDVIELPKEGDLCIFWDNCRHLAFISIFKERTNTAFHVDINRNTWLNCLKFVSKEQFKKLISEE